MSLDLRLAARLTSLALVSSIIVCTAAAAEPAATPTGFDVLVGRWVRPDGGYTITITSVDAAGAITAAYANPRPLPFARARAQRDGEALRLFFELRAGGYDGSTYTLTYDPAQDVLRGVYYQAVAKEHYDIQFQRVD